MWGGGNQRERERERERRRRKRKNEKNYVSGGKRPRTKIMKTPKIIFFKIILLLWVKQEESFIA